jgi:hypothetical protein
MKFYIPTKQEEEKLKADKKRIDNILNAVDRYAHFGAFRGTEGELSLSKDKTESLYLLLLMTHQKLKNLK